MKESIAEAQFRDFTTEYPQYKQKHLAKNLAAIVHVSVLASQCLFRKRLLEMKVAARRLQAGLRRRRTRALCEQCVHHVNKVILARHLQKAQRMRQKTTSVKHIIQRKKSALNTHAGLQLRMQQILETEIGVSSKMKLEVAKHGKPASKRHSINGIHQRRNTAIILHEQRMKLLKVSMCLDVLYYKLVRWQTQVQMNKSTTRTLFCPYFHRSTQGWCTLAISR